MKWLGFFKKKNCGVEVSAERPADIAAPKAKATAERASSVVPSVKIPPRPRRVETRPESPYCLKGGAKAQADWLLLQIGKTGRLFLTAYKKPGPAASPGVVREDVAAVLVGYRVVMSTYQFHQDPPSLETLRLVKTAMTTMLHRAVALSGEKSDGPSRAELLNQAEEQLRLAESDVREAVQARAKGQNERIFEIANQSLAPVFGSGAHARSLFDLMTKLESQMLERNAKFTA